jgi:FkbM family methyltransferase
VKAAAAAAKRDRRGAAIAGRIRSYPMSLSPAVRLIRKLPAGRRTALRIWNLLLIHLAPKADAPTYFGATMACDAHDVIQSTIIHFGVWEPAVSRAFELLVKPGDTVADVGANIGYYSLLSAHLVGEAGRVVAIEAHPRTAGNLRANLRANGASNVRVVEAAASDKDGSLPLFDAPATNIGMTTTRPESGFAFLCDVKAEAFHAMLTAQEKASLSLIKIDIEGAEIPVLRDILAHYAEFARSPAIVVEANVAQNPDWSSMFEQLAQRGFAAFDLHNDYSWENQLDNRIEAPTRLERLPSIQTDILFVPNALARDIERAGSGRANA